MIKRFLLWLGLGLFTVNASAVAPGFYVGIMGGPATNGGVDTFAQLDNSSATTKATPKTSQIGVRGYGGYKMNAYASFEAGLTYYSTINYNTDDDNTCTSPYVKLTVGDIVGVLSYPLWYFNVFAKGGIAIATMSISGSLNPTYTTTCGAKDNSLIFRPTASIGAGYDFSQNWVADVSWTRVMTYGIVQNVDMYALGFSYHFVDKYCGQFLCDD